MFKCDSNYKGAKLMATSPLQEPAAIFAAVREKLRESLPENVRDQIHAYQDPQQMLESTKGVLKQQSMRSSKVRGIISAVDRIASHWKPYFKVIDIYTQSNPDCSSLIWGTLRFIFQVCEMCSRDRLASNQNFDQMASNVSTIFQKIENMLTQNGLQSP